MSKLTDQDYLTKSQYKDSGNLDARIAIHKRFSANPYGWFNFVFDHLLSLPADAKILELGCGSGELWKECASRIPAGWALTLTDLSDGMLDAAWRNLIVIKRGIQFEKADAQSIPYADNTFDAVIANHMLYHVPDRPKAIAEVQRVLKPGGRFFAATVGDNHLKEITEWYRRANADMDWGKFTSSFTLENGMEQLKPFFANATLERYEDSLHVTELEPLVAYLRSGVRMTALSEEQLAKIAADLELQLRENGKIVISKDSGLFEGIKSVNSENTA